MTGRGPPGSAGVPPAPVRAQPGRTPLPRSTRNGASVLLPPEWPLKNPPGALRRLHTDFSCNSWGPVGPLFHPRMIRAEGRSGGQSGTQGAQSWVTASAKFVRPPRCCWSPSWLQPATSQNTAVRPMTGPRGIGPSRSGKAVTRRPSPATPTTDELLMTVSRMATVDDFAGGDIENGEQKGTPERSSRP